MLESLIGELGENRLLALGGLVIGIVFGALAQRSRFCLRSAALETMHGKFGVKLSVWLLAFSGALVLTQGFILADVLDVGNARQLATAGTLSGALVGGLLFGAGMILARGCSSRLLVLAGTGNLRSLLSGLVFAVVSQASLSGVLSPLRQWISSWSIVDSGARDLLTQFGQGHAMGLLFGLVWLAAGIFFAIHSRAGWKASLAGFGVGSMVAVAWLFNYQVSANSFEIVPVKALSFTGPAADVLMLVLSPPGHLWNFDIGLVPGVFIGAFLAAALNRELKLEGFRDGPSMPRYLVGAGLMGFGGMLAGGCAVGAGVSGASIFALTAWVTLFAIWGAAGITDYLVDRRAAPESNAIQPAMAQA